MKKLLLLLFLILGAATIINAQQKFEIGINSITVYANGKLVSIDSISIGQTVTLNISLKNEGAFPIKNGQYLQDSFLGGIYDFSYFVDSGKNTPEKTDFSHPLTLNGMAYLASQIVSDTFTATAAFFKPGNNNIVIIWPTGGRAIGANDTLDTVPKGQFNFYVYPEYKTSAIPNITQNNSFKIYPNPAKDLVNIQMNETGMGIIRLMDMTGKLITSMPYAANAGENISLPLNERASIPDGLYLIGIESGNGSQVSKIMICK